MLLDVVDVLIVAILCYRVLVLVRGTRAAQMVLGLALLAIVSVVAELLQLSSLDWLFENLRTVWVIGFLILFQPELRRGLAQLGQRRLFRRIFRVSETVSLGEIQRAIDSMAKKGRGGILVIERNIGLRTYAETGTPLEATVSAELIETIFTPPSPLHDGAAILRGNQIVAAGCILPLSQDPMLGRTLGTRHRAVVGISEETDAIAIAVSEETHQVSVAERGVLRRLSEPAALKDYLEGLLAGKDEVPAPSVSRGAVASTEVVSGRETPRR
jgi:diadenylate cyclase